jgi:hypothetical protein
MVAVAVRVINPIVMASAASFASCLVRFTYPWAQQADKSVILVENGARALEGRELF